MAKFYLVSQEITEFSAEHWIFATRRAAEKKVEALLGGYILDCIRDGDTAQAVEFVEKLIAEEDFSGYYTDDEDVYIEEIEVQDMEVQD